MSDHYSFITHKPLTNLPQILIGELRELGFPPEFWITVYLRGIDSEIFSISIMEKVPEIRNDFQNNFFL